MTCKVHLKGYLFKRVFYGKFGFNSDILFYIQPVSMQPKHDNFFFADWVSKKKNQLYMLQG